MKYRIRHETRYAYSQPVDLCHNEARLQPRDVPGQRCLGGIVEIEPATVVRAERLDAFGNRVLYFAVQEPHRELVVTATSEVELDDIARADPESPPWEAVRSLLHAASDAESSEARAFVLESDCAPGDPSLVEFARPSFRAGRRLVAVLRDLSARIHHELTFDPRITTVSTPPVEVLKRGGGVCQDFAHLAIACVRAHGVPARYVSGYLETTPPAGSERLRGADASHAWFAAYIPGYGWFDFDPTNDQSPDTRYVTTAWGRDYADVAPLKGVLFGGGAHTLSVGVDLERLVS